MHTIKKWQLLSVSLAVLMLLPHAGLAKRKPLVALAYGRKGEGKMYVPREEGQMFHRFTIYEWEAGDAEDTAEVWLVEIPTKTLKVDEPLMYVVNLIVQAEVTLDSAGKDYRYSYVLHSLKTSTGGATHFEVVFDPNLPFSDFAVPQRKPNPWYTLVWERERDPEGWKRGEKPLGWFGTLSYGESLGGFSFESPVLPSIVHCWSNVIIPDAEGYFLGGNTLGPVAVPDKFEPGEFSRRLMSMIDQSVSEGWIENEALAQDLKKQLEWAAKSMDKSQAESILSNLLKNVEEEKDRSLLSEAYGLLKYNVSYWLEQLEEGNKTKE